MWKEVGTLKLNSRYARVSFEYSRRKGRAGYQRRKTPAEF